MSIVHRNIIDHIAGLLHWSRSDVIRKVKEGAVFVNSIRLEWPIGPVDPTNAEIRVGNRIAHPHADAVVEALK